MSQPNDKSGDARAANNGNHAEDESPNQPRSNTESSGGIDVPPVADALVSIEKQYLTDGGQPEDEEQAGTQNLIRSQSPNKERTATARSEGENQPQSQQTQKQ